MKAVAPDVNERYQRAQRLLNDLLAARGRETTDARRCRARRRATPAPLLSRHRKTCRTSTTASKRAKRRSRASAGTAASRSTRDLRDARFVAKRSKC